MDTIAGLKPDTENAREHNPRNVGMIVKALHEVGAARSIVIDEDDNILAGNATIEAAVEAGIENLQIIDVDGETIVAVRRKGLTPEQKKRLAYFDNRTADVADWSAEQVLADLAGGFNLDDLFTEAELTDFGWEPDKAEDPGADMDRAEELQEKWQVKRGDVWTISEHRVMCGDATDAEDVKRLMGEKRAQLVFTDPPYGVGYDGGTTERDKLEGDQSTALYEPACKMSALFSDDKAALYLWHAGIKGIAAAAAAAAAAAGYEIRCELVWNKNQAQYGALSAQYKQKHEPCYYCFKRGHAPRWYGPTNEVTVWDCDRAPVNEHHPTQKPPELAVRAIENSSEGGHLVVDWFLGSGTTIVACEQTGRIGYGMEIAEKYVAVSLERLAGMGLEPRLSE